MKGYLKQELFGRCAYIRWNSLLERRFAYNYCVNRTDNHDIDPTDRAIIGSLQRNARSTYGDIGQLVGLSAPAVKRRMDKLEEEGVILQYTAVVDHARMGRPLEAFTEVRFSGDTGVDAIANLGEGIPEIEAVFTTAGDPDALVWLRVKDVRDLKRVIDQLRSSGKVTGTKTMMVLGTSVRSGIVSEKG